MKEQLISFETAKLAKEKGFDIKTKHWYDQTETLNPVRGIRGSMVYHNIGYAPTQSLLQKWLREKYNMQIDISSDLEDGNLEYYIDVFTIDRKNLDCVLSSMGYIYEDTLEKGLFEALKLIK